MRTATSTLVSILALWCASIAGASAADDVAVRYSLQAAAGKGALATGTINVIVSNLSNGALRNVDLRLAQPGPNSIEKPLLQFGTIPAGEARIAKGSFIFDAGFHASGATLLWKVDYDDAGGAHRQVVLPGIRTER
jgi:PPE-repeat protein